MLIRVVQMHITTGFIATASDILKNYAPNVRAFPGCNFLEISIEAETGLVITYSYWNDLAALETYRKSEMFINFWKSMKSHFSKPAQAFSLKSLVRCD